MTVLDALCVENQTQAELLVGRKLREFRISKGLSLRALADRSGLNINTLSLVENGKSSPSVSTLQQLSVALNVPIAAFFESEPVQKRVVFTAAGQRPEANFGRTQIQNLGKDLAGNTVQPFAVTLKPGTGSGEHLIVHTGHEFVYCLSGSVQYRIDETDYELNPGDSIVFEAHLPHFWKNNGDDTAQILLVLFPSDQRDEPGGRHFSAESMKKEIHMKVAVITEDGKTVSQHFGRAPYYLVLTIAEGKIVKREKREKLGHNQFGGQHHGEEHHGPEHGMDAGAHNKHASMAEAIADCKAILCGGMGAGAYNSMLRLNIQPIVTDVHDIDEAVQAYIDGSLVDHTELLH